MSNLSGDSDAGAGGEPPRPADKPGDGGTFSQSFNHNPISARVPERVAHGVMSTGVLVLDSPNEFVLDFLQGMTRPYQIVSRVVITPLVMNQLVQAVQENLNKYVSVFGKPPALPAPPKTRPTIAEIYENFKLPEELLSGHYANSVRIGHTPAEFFFDFITTFYPNAAVSARVYMSAPQIPRLLDTLTLARANFDRRFNQPPTPKDSSPPKEEI